MPGSFPVIGPSSRNQVKILSFSPSITILLLYISDFFKLLDNFFPIPNTSFLKVLLLSWGQNQIQKKVSI